MGSHGDALPLFVRALEIREAVLGASHPATAQSLNNLGQFHVVAGEFAKEKSSIDSVSDSMCIAQRATLSF